MLRLIIQYASRSTKNIPFCSEFIERILFPIIPCHNIEIPQVQMNCLADLASQLGMMDT